MIFQQKLSESSDNTDVWTATPARRFFAVSRSERWTENTVFHASLNPSPEDRLTDDQLRDIAQEYMERMGYGNQPYIVFKHKDIDRQHLHVVSLRVDENGHKLSHDFETE